MLKTIYIYTFILILFVIIISLFVAVIEIIVMVWMHGDWRVSWFETCDRERSRTGCPEARPSCVFFYGFNKGRLLC